MVEILKVSSKSNPNSVAGALAGVVRGAGSVEMQVVGAGALNQAVKALAIARSYIANSGMDLACRPTFADIIIDGEERTAIRLLVEKFTPVGGVAPPLAAERPATDAAVAADPGVDGTSVTADGAGAPIDARPPIDARDHKVDGVAPAAAPHVSA